MRLNCGVFARALSSAGLALGLCAFAGDAQAEKDHILYSFQGGSDGAGPYAGLLLDDAGNFYGTASYGGGSGCNGVGCGTVFELKKDGSETVLYSFQGGSDGEVPEAQLIMDKAGNLYGTTTLGGDSAGACAPYGCGTVFKLAPNGKKSILHTFTFTDGDQPLHGVARDSAGNLYGTTYFGGTTDGPCSPYGCGVAFEIAPDGTETVLRTFTGGTTDGSGPFAGVIRDSAGNLYGTTEFGGGSGCLPSNGCGTVFRITPDGTETLLYSFTGGADGALPLADLTMDASGNLYGTTDEAGAGSDAGVVFELKPDGTETTLYTFPKGKNGFYPGAGVIRDKEGNLYGVTIFGGDNNSNCNEGTCGVVYKIAPDGTETVLHRFTGGKDAANSQGDLILDKNGNLYGMSFLGGGDTQCITQSWGCGAVFELKK